MAISGLLMGVVSGALERKKAIALSLFFLSFPTALLAFAPNLTVFAILRVTQGLFMAAAFTLTLAHLAERCAVRTANALAAYVTGVVASNLIGRLTAAYVASLIGAEQSFLFFALLNLAGAALVTATLHKNAPEPMVRMGRFWAPWLEQLADPALRRTFAIGFLILFGFIGVFTYVGFVLMRPPHALSMTALGLVFLVFLPSMITTPLAGVRCAVDRAGTRLLDQPGPRLARARPPAGPEPVLGDRRNDAGRRGHLLRASGGDGTRWTHRQKRTKPRPAGSIFRHIIAAASQAPP